MSNIKHMDIDEFRYIGFLQEANRQFFHPHGLALEITTATEGGDDPLREKVEDVIRREADNFLEPDQVARLAAAITNQIHPLGSSWLSGVWDYREDAEGIYYGDWQPDALAKVERVAAERKRHENARTKMFGKTPPSDGFITLCSGDRPDVEPTTFVEPRDTRPAVDLPKD